MNTTTCIFYKNDYKSHKIEMAIKVTGKETQHRMLYCKQDQDWSTFTDGQIVIEGIDFKIREMEHYNIAESLRTGTPEEQQELLQDYLAKFPEEADEIMAILKARSEAAKKAPKQPRINMAYKHPETGAIFIVTDINANNTQMMMKCIRPGTMAEFKAGQITSVLLFDPAFFGVWNIHAEEILELTEDEIADLAQANEHRGQIVEAYSKVYETTDLTKSQDGENQDDDIELAFIKRIENDVLPTEVMRSFAKMAAEILDRMELDGFEALDFTEYMKHVAKRTIELQGEPFTD